MLSPGKEALRALLHATFLCQLISVASADPVVVPVEGARALEPAAGVWDKRISAILNEARNADGPARAQLMEELSDLGPDSLQPLFEVLALGRLPGESEHPSAVLDDAQEKLLLHALGATSQPALFGMLRETAVRSQDVPTRLAALRLLAAHGDEDHLQLVIDVGFLVDVEGRPHEAVAEAFEDALTQVLRREPTSHAPLRRIWPAAPKGLRATILRSVGRSGDPDGLKLMGRVLVREPELLPVTICQITLLAPLAPSSVAESLSWSLREHLWDADLGTCRGTALALAALGDIDCIPALIDLLDHESHAMRETALWALRDLSGMALPALPELWAAWHDEQQAWFVREAPVILLDLASESDIKVVGALQAVAGHPLFRSELMPDLLPVLTHLQPSIRVMVCQTLAQLGASSAVPDLVKALDDEQQSVRDSAYQALKSITGREEDW